MVERACWCGSSNLLPFSLEYARCSECGTLVSQVGLSNEELKVGDDERDFYGKKYWFEHQTKDLGFPDIYDRARNDLTDRNIHWLRTLLTYRLPPARVLELGCSHGSFVALLNQAGYAATGLEMSPWVVEFARKTFDISVALGPVEEQEFAPSTVDVIALMDVLEHLPDPRSTMAHCLRLLKADGLLLIQTPRFRESMSYEDLLASNHPFMEQFKSNEHLFLFTRESVSRLFSELGAHSIVFEQAIFEQYDMFFAVEKDGTTERPSSGEVTAALAHSTRTRIVQALLDLSNRIDVIEKDRAERLEQINILTQMVRDLQAGPGSR